MSDNLHVVGGVLVVATAGVFAGVYIATDLDDTHIVEPQHAALDKALQPVKDRAYLDQLAAGTLTMTGANGQPLTLRCSAPKNDGNVWDCGVAKYRDDEFKNLVRIESEKKVAEQFAGAYAHR